MQGIDNNSFDSEILASGLGYSEGAQNLRGMVDEQDRIYRRMEQARARMLQQTKADEIKSDLIDKVRAEKKAEVGLSEKVAALETTDPQLFQYIRKLEMINTSIWCAKCESIKNVPGQHVQECEVTTSTGGAVENVATTQELEKIKENYGVLQTYANKIRAEYNEKIRMIFEAMAELRQQIDKLAGTSGRPAAQPTSNIDALIEEKFLEITADNLLGER